MDFFHYLKYKGTLLAYVLLTAAACWVIFCLYRLPSAALLYPGLMAAVLGLGFLLLDFWRRKREVKRIRMLKKLPTGYLNELLPASTWTEEEYRELIGILTAAQEQMKREAAETMEEMTDYYSVWAHQIKTPLASMRLQLQGEDSERSRGVTAELSRVEQYVDMAMVYLRLGAESTDYVFRKQSLDPLIRQSVRKFSSDFISRRLTLDYTPIELSIVTDEKWFCFVLEQLLSNALKYTRQGGIRIFLEGDSTLCVKDSGIGIAPEDLPRIFEKGYTGYNGRRNKGASGIGLYLCRRVCDRLGIGLSAVSAPGQGTELRLTLPLQETRNK